MAVCSAYRSSSQLWCQHNPFCVALVVPSVSKLCCAPWHAADICWHWRQSNFSCHSFLMPSVRQCLVIFILYSWNQYCFRCLFCWSFAELGLCLSWEQYVPLVGGTENAQSPCLGELCCYRSIRSNSRQSFCPVAPLEQKESAGEANQ